VLKLYAGVPRAQLLHFYMTVMQPILEYSAPFWHHSLSKCQIDQTEAIQKKRLNVIYTYTMPYSNTQFLAGLTSLTTDSKRTTDTQAFPLILPSPNDSSLLSPHAPKRPSKFSHVFHRTKKYQFFLA